MEEDTNLTNSVSYLRDVYLFGVFCVGTTGSLLAAGASVVSLLNGFSSGAFMGFWIFAPLAFFMYVGACRTMSRIRITTAEHYSALSTAEFLAKQYRDQNIGLPLRLSMKDEQGAVAEGSGGKNPSATNVIPLNKFN